MLNIRPVVKEDSQRICEESDVLENVLYFIKENSSTLRNLSSLQQTFLILSLPLSTSYSNR